MNQISLLFRATQSRKKVSRDIWASLLRKELEAQEISGLPSKSADGVEPDQDRDDLTSLQLEIELEFWKSVEQDDTVALYQAYLKQFPDGVFAPIAKLRIEQGKTE